MLGQDDLWLNDPRAAVQQLGTDLDRFAEMGDLDALAQAEEQATKLIGSSSGRTRRQAERVAARARSAIEGLRDEAREAERAEKEARALSEVLRARVVSTLQLLLNDGREPSAIIAPILAAPNPGSEISAPPTLASMFDAWDHLISTSFEHSERVYGSIPFEIAAEDRLSIVRLLKSIAVELMTAGAPVGTALTDPVPLIAYALANDWLPVTPEFRADPTRERIDDLLLSMAGGVSELPPSERRLFVALFQIGALIGQAQVYADRFGLRFVPLFGKPPEEWRPNAANANELHAR